MEKPWYRSRVSAFTAAIVYVSIGLIMIQLMSPDLKLNMVLFLELVFYGVLGAFLTVMVELETGVPATVPKLFKIKRCLRVILAIFLTAIMLGVLSFVALRSALGGAICFTAAYFAITFGGAIALACDPQIRKVSSSKLEQER